MRDRERPPVSLHDSLVELTGELRVPGPDAMRVVSENWASIVGPELAPHAKLGSLRAGILTLDVDDPTWATPLRYLESGIVDALTERLGRGVVVAVKIVVRRGREQH